MADRYTIWMNYSQALREADRLARQATRLERLGSGRMASLIGESSAGWHGENADAYRVQMNRFREELSRTANQLNRMSDTIRRIAQNTYQADMRALELAEKRTY